MNHSLLVEEGCEPQVFNSNRIRVSQGNFCVAASLWNSKASESRHPCAQFKHASSSVDRLISRCSKQTGLTRIIPPVRHTNSPKESLQARSWLSPYSEILNSLLLADLLRHDSRSNYPTDEKAGDHGVIPKLYLVTLNCLSDVSVLGRLFYADRFSQFGPVKHYELLRHDS